MESFTVKKGRVDIILYAFMNKKSNRPVDGEIRITGHLDLLDTLRDGLENFTYQIKDAPRG